MALMTGFRPGDVVLVPFPFSDLSGTKKRPALVLAAVSNGELICTMLTSRQKADRCEHVIAAWREAGLIKPTVVRIARLFTIDRSVVLRKLGSLEVREFREVLAKVVALLVVGIC